MGVTKTIRTPKRLSQGLKIGKNSKTYIQRF
jgi:hypothetical protein